jgi:hypothetical protein
MQQTSSLEARVAALERKRDLVITPVTDLTARNNINSGHAEMGFPWFGGRIWVVLGGRFYTTSAYTENTGGYISYPKINGVGLGPAPLQGFGKASAGGVLGTAAYASTDPTTTFGTNPSNLIPGTNVLSFDINSLFMTTVTMVALNGFILEWPSA